MAKRPVSPRNKITWPIHNPNQYGGYYFNYNIDRRKKEGENMFNFRIITCPDGTDIIDPTSKTPYSSLTPVQMQEYMEIDTRIAFMERMKRKAAKKALCRKKRRNNPIYRLAYMCKLIWLLNTKKGNKIQWQNVN